MSAHPRPRVTIEPARGNSDPERFLAAVEDTIERANVLKRDGVIVSVEVPATDGGLTAFNSNPAETAEHPTAVQDDPQDPPADELQCGHARAYEEGGECMACTQRFNTDAERRARTAAASDDLEGKL